MDVEDTKPRSTETERNARGANDWKAMVNELKSILTEIQFKKWQEIKANKKPRKIE